MPLVVDAPLPDAECWARELTNEDHVTSNQTVHYQALKKTAFASARNKPWAHELSGRAVSVASDLLQHGEDRVRGIRQKFTTSGKVVPSKIKFMGVACAKAHELRLQIVGVPAHDVIFTPNNDPAHSDFVTFGTVTDADIEPARYWPMKFLRVVDPPNLADVPATCGLSRQRSVISVPIAP